MTILLQTARKPRSASHLAAETLQSAHARGRLRPPPVRDVEGFVVVQRPHAVASQDMGERVRGPLRGSGRRWRPNSLINLLRTGWVSVHSSCWRPMLATHHPRSWSCSATPPQRLTTSAGCTVRCCPEGLFTFPIGVPPPSVGHSRSIILLNASAFGKPSRTARSRPRRARSCATMRISRI
jgi:hypothetical protein